MMKDKMMSPNTLDWKSIDRRLRAALREDIGPGDVTSRLTIPAGNQGRAIILAKQTGVLCGVEIARRVFQIVDRRIRFTAMMSDGADLAPGDKVAEARGPMHGILAAERTALNVVQRLSGIATKTAAFAEPLAPFGAKVYDTRKTTPLWRDLEKYAVATGGGSNYRIGLFDMIMIKDNHADAAGGVEAALQRVLRGNRRRLPVVVEVRSLDDLRAALAYPVQVIMLDNMSDAQIRAALRLAAKSGAKCEIEVSGGLTAARALRLAKMGVRRFSAGALTHSAPALDISLDYTK